MNYIKNSRLWLLVTVAASLLVFVALRYGQAVSVNV